MPRTLKELTAAQLAIDAECEALWLTVWAPRFDAANSVGAMAQLFSELAAAANVQWSDDLPGLLSVYHVFAMDAFRQRMKSLPKGT